MRVILGVVLFICIIMVGFVAMSYAADSVQDQAVTNGTNTSADAFNVTKDVTERLGQVGAELFVYAGVAAIILVALGFLVKAGASGR